MKILNELWSAHFCLVLVHICLIFGISSHFLSLLKTLSQETKLCILINPSSYTIFLAFGLVVVSTSILCIRQANRQTLSIWFMDHIKKAYYVLVLLAILMLTCLFISQKACRIKHSVTSWTVIWSIFCTIESLVLIAYSNWFIRELKDLGFGQDSDPRDLKVKEGA